MEIVVSYTGKGDVHTLCTGNKALGDLIINQALVPVDERGGTAKQLLASAALYCYCAALSGALKARGLADADIRGKAILHTDTNGKGQGRVSQITLDVTVHLSENDSSIFERCEKIMQHGCLITGSLHDGVEMKYCLNAEYLDD